MNPTTITSADDLLEKLCEQFGYTAEWRRQKAEEYPDDPRNIRAAEQLEKLAGTVANVSPLMARRYAALHDERDGLLIAEAESEALRLVGFHRFPDTAEEFLRDLVEEASSRP